MGDKHHAYAQPENDGDAVRTLDMKIGDRTWRCAGWMAIQAHEFVQLVKIFPDDVQLDVRGDGLLAGILQFAADKAKEGA
jgi:hypothetical protein